MIKITRNSKLKVLKFRELCIGDVFTRVKDGDTSLYMKFSKDEESNNSIMLEAPSTWQIRPEEYVIVRNVEIIVN